MAFQHTVLAAVLACTLVFFITSVRAGGDDISKGGAETTDSSVKNETGKTFGMMGGMGMGMGGMGMGMGGMGMGMGGMGMMNPYMMMMMNPYMMMMNPYMMMGRR